MQPWAHGRALTVDASPKYNQDSRETQFRSRACARKEHTLCDINPNMTSNNLANLDAKRVYGWSMSVMLPCMDLKFECETFLNKYIANAR